MARLLPNIHSPADLKELSLAELDELASEIRAEICSVVAKRSAHFASNLGVVELTLALHTVFDFSYDRLVWDVGHQTYPHKLVTGRNALFSTIRTRGGLMGYPNPAESLYDLFMTGHAGCSISSAVGLQCGDDLMRAIEEAENLPEIPCAADSSSFSSSASSSSSSAPSATPSSRRPPRHVVAVIGDGSFANGVVFEGLNHLGALKKNITVILNDNKMSICPRVGSIGQYLDTLRMNPFYTEMKADLKQTVQNIPLVGPKIRSTFHDMKMAFKACVSGGILFEELGIRYIGPVDGHDIRQMQKFLTRAKDFRGPVLLHVLTQKGRGYSPAEHDPAHFHAPSPQQMVQGITLPGNSVPKNAPSPSGCASSPASTPASSPASSPVSGENPVSLPASGENSGKSPDSALFSSSPLNPAQIPDRSYTMIASQKIMALMERDPRVVVITAAMCQGNKLELIRQKYPERFFDVGICESHAVVLAAGMARAGLHPIVDIYSTFMQRAFDHIFQEVSLQNLPVVLLMDRAGLVGADGPTHHGMYDLAYLRPFPNLVMTAPCDAYDLEKMLELAVTSDAPFSVRYSKTQAPEIQNVVRTPVTFGACEILQDGTPGGGLILACGVQAAEALAAVRKLQDAAVTVINLRFVKPLDLKTILPRIQSAAWVLTVEEGARIGGVGAALLEAAADAQISLPPFRRLGVEDVFIQHASRSEQLAETGLDENGIINSVRELNAASVRPK